MPLLTRRSVALAAALAACLAVPAASSAQDVGPVSAPAAPASVVAPVPSPVATAALPDPLAVAAAAAPVTVAATQPCVLDSVADLSVTSGGWAPNAALTFSLGGQPVGSGVADGTGSFANASTPFTPVPLTGTKPIRRLELGATDANGVAAVPSTVKVVRRTVTIPARAKPGKRVRYRAYGFPIGRKLYLHVRQGKHELGRFGMGRPHGDCGVLSTHLRYMPLHHWSTGTYDFWFSNRRHFTRKTALYGYRIKIYKTLG
jgi:hypothetical protein